MALRRWLVRAGWLVLVAATVFIAAAVVGRFVLHGAVDERSLARSIGWETGTDATLAECRRSDGARLWSCAVSDGSAGASYRVVVRPSSSCWDATRVGGHHEGPDVPREAGGCVRAWQWSLIELLT